MLGILSRPCICIRPASWIDDAGERGKGSGQRLRCAQNSVLRRHRLSSASTDRAPSSSLFSSSRHARRFSCPWGARLYGQRASTFSVPAYPQSWWYLPLVTSFTAISSGFPDSRVDVTLMLTGIDCRGKVCAASATAPARYPAYNEYRAASKCPPPKSEAACSALAFSTATDELRSARNFHPRYSEFPHAFRQDPPSPRAGHEPL